MVEKHALTGDIVDVVCCGCALLHDRNLIHESGIATDKYP